MNCFGRWRLTRVVPRLEARTLTWSCQLTPRFTLRDDDSARTVASSSRLLLVALWRDISRREMPGNLPRIGPHDAKGIPPTARRHHRARQRSPDLPSAAADPPSLLRGSGHGGLDRHGGVARKMGAMEARQGSPAMIPARARRSSSAAGGVRSGPLLGTTASRRRGSNGAA